MRKSYKEMTATEYYEAVNEYADILIAYGDGEWTESDVIEDMEIQQNQGENFLASLTDKEFECFAGSVAQAVLARQEA